MSVTCNGSNIWQASCSSDLMPFGEVREWASRVGAVWSCSTVSRAEPKGSAKDGRRRRAQDQGAGRWGGGPLYHYDSTRVNPGLFQHDVNVIWDRALHDLSIMDYLIGLEPDLVVTRDARRGHLGERGLLTVRRSAPRARCCAPAMSLLVPVPHAFVQRHRPDSLGRKRGFAVTG